MTKLIIRIGEVYKKCLKKNNQNKYFPIISMFLHPNQNLYFPIISMFLNLYTYIIVDICCTGPAIIEHVFFFNPFLQWRRPSRPPAGRPGPQSRVRRRRLSDRQTGHGRVRRLGARRHGGAARLRSGAAEAQCAADGGRARPAEAVRNGLWTGGAGAQRRPAAGPSAGAAEAAVPGAGDAVSMADGRDECEDEWTSM